MHSFICKALRGAAVLFVPQAPDNAANERMHFAQRVKIFQAFLVFNRGDKVYFRFLGQIRIYPIIIISFLNFLKNFHEITGLIS